MKKCNGKCQQIRSETDFGRNSNSPDKLNYVCKECNTARAKEWYSNNSEKAKQRRTTAKKTPLTAKRSNLKRYGLTVEDYDRMFKEQNSACAICNQLEVLVDQRSGKLLNLAVDHCHVTGKVRGLLCSRCNKMLGLSSDNLEILSKAQEYLVKSQMGYN